MEHEQCGSDEKGRGNTRYSPRLYHEVFALHSLRTGSIQCSDTGAGTTNDTFVDAFLVFTPFHDITDSYSAPDTSNHSRNREASHSVSCSRAVFANRDSRVYLLNNRGGSA